MSFTGTKKKLKARIFDVQGLSVHDGPGCRTLIFMQGCSLNCIWCSNPEGISLNSSLLYFADNCRLDGNCVKDCEFDAISIENDKLIIDRRLCEKCLSFNCINNCYTKALRKSSEEYSVEKLLKIVQRDRQYWGHDGGISLSGGEPLLNIDFVEEFLKQCYNSYIHTAIETCANVPWSYFERTMAFLDWIFIDIKHLDTNIHRGLTGAGNELILSNLKRLAKEFKGRIIVRIPLIPAVNDGLDNVQDYIKLFKENNITEVNILPLHHYGREKYKLLQKDYLMTDLNSQKDEQLKEIQKAYSMAGIKCYSGSITPF